MLVLHSSFLNIGTVPSHRAVRIAPVSDTVLLEGGEVVVMVVVTGGGRHLHQTPVFFVGVFRLVSVIGVTVLQVGAAPSGPSSSASLFLGSGHLGRVPFPPLGPPVLKPHLKFKRGEYMNRLEKKDTLLIKVKPCAQPLLARQLAGGVKCTAVTKPMIYPPFFPEVSK